MKHGFAIALALLLAACSDNPEQTTTPTPTPDLPQGLDAVELDMDTADSTTTATRSSGSGLTFVPLGAAQVCSDRSGHERFVVRSFNVTHQGTETLNNLHIHAYTQTGHVGGTALKTLSAFGGMAQPDAQQALPRHGMLCDSDAAVLSPDPQRADLQLYTSADLATRRASVPNWPSGVELLGYGFLAQQRSGQPDTDNNPRTLAPGESARITLAFKVPVGTDPQYRFKTTFALFTNSPRNELVQTPEDQRAGTTAGLSTLPANTARVGVLGGAACGLSGNNRFQTQVLIGKTATAEITDTALDAPATFSTITSAQSQGAGSLHEALGNAVPGAALCFTQNIAAIGLTIDRDLTLMGGENAALNGQNVFRGLHITQGTVQLYGFRIYQGRSDEGGGIYNAGTLTLRGMQVVDNSSGSETLTRGAGIFSSGPLHIFNSTVSNNIAAGDPGVSDSNGIAGTGGMALGGGIYMDNAPLRLQASAVTGNGVRGGQGASGRSGMEEFQGTEPPGFAFCSVIPTDGGSGGSAEGGGVFKGGSATLDNPGAVWGNFAAAGDPGPGGDTPGVCSQYWANLGSFGNVGQQDVAP